MHILSIAFRHLPPDFAGFGYATEGALFYLRAAVHQRGQRPPKGLGTNHTPSIAFRHFPPNSARFGYTTEWVLFISVQLSTDAVGALRKIWVLIKLQALVYDILSSTTAVFSYAIGSRKLSAKEQFCCCCWSSNSSKFVTNNSNYISRLFYN